MTLNEVTIVVEITNIPSQNGYLLIALFNSEHGFRDEKFAIRKAQFNITNTREIWKFENLPSGRYAIAVFHDENHNLKLDTNIFSVPIESYGFSNDAMGFLGPPDFEAASVILKEGTRVVSIKLH